MLEVREETMKKKGENFHRLSLSITSISLFLLNQKEKNTTLINTKEKKI